MDGSFATAIYAAVVASSALGWQIYSWRKDRRPRLRVEACLSPQHDTPILVQSNIMIAAYNTGDRPIGIREMGFWRRGLARGDRRIRPGEMWGSGIPATLGPQQAAWVATTKKRAEEAGINTAEPVIGYAWLVSGEIVRSKPVTLPWDTPPKAGESFDPVSCVMQRDN